MDCQSYAQKADIAETKTLHNYRNFVFEVLPKLSYDASLELRKNEDLIQSSRSFRTSERNDSAL